MLLKHSLIEDFERGRFSLPQFLERRARRLLPAMALVIITSVPFAWAWMSPAQFKEFSQSLAAASVFGSNTLFWRLDGYFAETAAIKPLIHTWSLAIEGQFYLIFAFGLMVIWRFGKSRVLWTITLIAATSFLLAEWGWRNHPSAAFYLLPTRAWELLAGAICAFVLHESGARKSNLLGTLGLALIVVPAFVYDSATPFPSVYALAPVGGTVLIVVFGAAGTWAAQILSTPFLVSVGLMSYSLFLWHYPFLAFARLRSITGPSEELIVGLVIVAVGVSYLSWRFVELPFRTRPAPILPSRNAFVAAAAVAISGCFAFGSFVHVRDGIVVRTATVARFTELDQRLITNFGLDPACDWTYHESDRCRTSNEPEVLLWGDSFAMHLVQALLASNPKPSVQQHTLSSCAPVVGMAQRDAKGGYPWTENCLDFNDEVLRWLLKKSSVRIVVLSSAFSMLDSDIMLRDGSMIDDEQKTDALADAFLATIEQIKQAGKRVVIVSPMVGNGTDIGGCIRRAMIFGAAEGACDFIAPADRGQAFRLLDKLSKQVPVIRLDEMVCPDGRCDVIHDGTLIYKDHGHLSKEGSASIGRRFNFANLVTRIAE